MLKPIKQIANPAEPVNGQDERCRRAAVDSPVRLCCSVIKRATAQNAAALYHYSERGIFHPLFVCGKIALLESIELAAALSALSRMEQEIIFLYYFQRWTHREIGQRYGRAGNTTGRRIQMILRQLRAKLEGLSYEPATSL